MRKVTLAVSLLLCAAGIAKADQDIVLVIENHRFQPAETHVSAGQKIRIVVDNRDATPEEFESAKLRAERVVPAKSKAAVMVGPLKPGRYTFFGDYNQDTAQGALIAD